MNQNTKICSCKSIKQSDIKKAIHKSHVFNFDKYMELSYLGSGCGRCVDVARKIFENEISLLGNNRPYTLDL